MRRGDLIRARREYLEKMAGWLKLRWDPAWSRKHLASLIYWRITRTAGRNRH